MKNTIILLSILLLTVNVFSQNVKPKIIAMTDGEIDDQTSMIRFLLYTCDMDLEAIIETNSIYQKNGHSDKDWYEKQLEAYERIYPNLIIHNPDYPTADEIRAKSYVGDEDFEHLKKCNGKYRRPGQEVIYKPDNWNDTPGSDKIVQVLLEDDPLPVYIQAWGGGNTAARAFYKLKTQYPEDYERAISKVVMYHIWYQDGAGNYIETYHPLVRMVYCGAFSGSWDYNSQKETYEFVSNNVKNNHGPLGALYPQDYISEGDSPAFLYTITNGLRNYENPTYGGWGGRFKKFDKFENVFVDASDDGVYHKSLKRWIADANRDFQARMDWCVSYDYNEANHRPVAKLKSKTNITVRAGKTVKLNAKKSYDSDGDEIGFEWWQYKDAGTYDGKVEIKNYKNSKASFIAPKVAKPETIHIILKVIDDSEPKLCSYQRVIYDIVP